MLITLGQHLHSQMLVSTYSPQVLIGLDLVKLWIDFTKHPHRMTVVISTPHQTKRSSNSCVANRVSVGLLASCRSLCRLPRPSVIHSHSTSGTQFQKFTWTYYKNYYVLNILNMALIIGSSVNNLLNGISSRAAITAVAVWPSFSSVIHSHLTSGK